MPILGMYVPDALQHATAEALRSWLESKESSLIRLYTRAERLILRRTPYTGDFHIWGWETTQGYFNIAKFAMLPMPGCRAICVFHHVEVEPRFQRMGLGGTFLKLRLTIAKQVGYSVVICTVRYDNGLELELLRKNDFRCEKHFVNVTTAHDVCIWTKTL